MTQLCNNNLTIPGTRNAIQIPTAGRYTILLTESGSIFRPYGYHLNVERLVPPTDSAPLLLPSEPVIGSINPTGDRDLYRYALGAGDRYAFGIKVTAGRGEPTMLLIDSLGATRTIFSGMVFTTPTSGLFGLWVLDQGDNEVFDYELEFVCQGERPLSCPRPGPTINGIFNSANSRATICPGSFASVYGTYFSTVLREWELRDFAGSRLPTALEGLSVTFGDRPGYVAFVSVFQANVIVPDLPAGDTTVTVRTTVGSTQTKLQIAENCPAAFMMDDQRFAVAVYTNRSLASTPTFRGTNLRPGHIVSLYVNGLGPTLPAYRNGEILVTPAQTASPTFVTVGGIPARVLYSGLTLTGVYQVNIEIPNVPAGEQPVVIQNREGRSPAQVNLLVFP